MLLTTLYTVQQEPLVLTFPEEEDAFSLVGQHKEEASYETEY